MATPCSDGSFLVSEQKALASTVAGGFMIDASDVPACFVAGLPFDLLPLGYQAFDLSLGRPVWRGLAGWVGADGAALAPTLPPSA